MTDRPWFKRLLVCLRLQKPRPLNKFDPHHNLDLSKVKWSDILIQERETARAAWEAGHNARIYAEHLGIGCEAEYARAVADYITGRSDICPSVEISSRLTRMEKTDREFADEITQLRTSHYELDGMCSSCEQPWPCLYYNLTVEVDILKDELLDLQSNRLRETFN